MAVLTSLNMIKALPEDVGARVALTGMMDRVRGREGERERGREGERERGREGERVRDDSRCRTLALTTVTASCAHSEALQSH